MNRRGYYFPINHKFCRTCNHQYFFPFVSALPLSNNTVVKNRLDHKRHLEQEAKGLFLYPLRLTKLMSSCELRVVKENYVLFPVYGGNSWIMLHCGDICLLKNLRFVRAHVLCNMENKIYRFTCAEQNTHVWIRKSTKSYRHAHA